MAILAEHCSSGELDSALGQHLKPLFFNGFIGESPDLATLP